MQILDRHKDMVRFAAGLDERNQLDAATQQRALDSLARIAERLRNIPRERIRVVGTNTLRAASNAADFLRRAESVLGVPINIISGTEEARLIYLGTANDFSPDHRRRLVVDIGGGSTEIVVGTDQPELLQSLPIGCVSFSQRFFPDGAISSSFPMGRSAQPPLTKPWKRHSRSCRLMWSDCTGSGMKRWDLRGPSGPSPASLPPIAGVTAAPSPRRRCSA